VLVLRVAIIAAVLVSWEALARSGLLFRDVVPPLQAIGGAFVAIVTSAEFYFHLSWTLLEAVIALVIGAVLGVFAGLGLGVSKLLHRAFVPSLYYLGSTPKLVFFPVMIMLFGVGIGSKIALGIISCFFPVALSTAAGVRQINPVLIKVGRSFCADPWHMVRAIYLPAMREPILTGLRLGLGLTVIVTLLAETKLSNQGVGHLIIRAFTTFDMPRMYALLIAVFVIAIAANAALGRLSGQR
jgi:ABC-type nitrate/sulfonate/bicarbonate transport system permease component